MLVMSLIYHPILRSLENQNSHGKSSQERILSSIQRSDAREANEARGECGLQKLISCTQLDLCIACIKCICAYMTLLLLVLYNCIISCIELEPSVLHALSVLLVLVLYYCIISCIQLAPSGPTYWANETHIAEL